MASEEDIWQLIVKTVGQEDLKKLEAGLKDLNDEAAKVDGTTKGAAKGTTDFGRAALEGSRAMEDLQYGIGGVLNNVPNLVMMLGGPAGLAGAISLTAVGVVQLIKHWDDLMRLLGTGEELHQTGTQLENITKRIKEINDKEVKVAVDTSELEALEKQLKAIKEAQAEFEAAQKRQKGAERESGKAVEEALAESAGGLPGVSATLKAQFVKEKGAVSPELQEALARQAELQKTIATALDPDRVREAQAQLQEVFPRIRQANANVAKEAEAAAGDLLKRAREGKGPDLGAAQGDLARRLGGDLGRQVMAASPEALEQAQAEEDDFNRHMERAKTAGQMRREKAADAAKKARAATAEAKKTQAEVDRHTDAWAKEGEDFIADRERAAKAAPRLAREKAKQEQEAQTAALAQNIQRMAPRFEGIQFTPAQAKAAADQAMKSMEQQINADQAILMAMDGILNTMAKAGNRFANVQMQAVRAARQANGMGDFFDQKQPGAGNVGGN